MNTGCLLLNIQPTELKFPIELGKQSSCSLQLTNKTYQYVAFKVKTTNPRKYCVGLNIGIVLPGATLDVTVKMQAQKEAPPNMQCKDKFLIQSVVAPYGATKEDITPEMFDKEVDKVVEEFKLTVNFVPANPPSLVLEKSEGICASLPSTPGGETTSLLSTHGNMQSLATQSALRTMSRMLDERVHTDVTINTSDGTLRAHKAILSSSSPVFQSMFLHDLREKDSSTIQIDDMSWEACTTLVSYMYGTIKREDFWNHRLALLEAANKYDMTELKCACELSLLEDINSGNVLERLQFAWLYRLDKLKKGCFVYLFDYGKMHDVKDETSNFFQTADRDLLVEMIQELFRVWKPAKSTCKLL